MISDKKGQVTVFIILGVLILAVFASYFFFKSFTTTESLSAQEIIVDTTPIQLYVEGCLEKTAQDTINFISLQGGYYHLPKTYLDYSFVKIPYYFDDGNENFPSKENIASEMEKYFKINLPKCINNFLAFKSKGYLIQEGEIEPEIYFGSQVLFNIDYPLLITKGDPIINNEIIDYSNNFNSITEQSGKIKELNKFSTQVNLDFDQIYSIINDTVLEHRKNINSVPIGHLSLSAYENDYKFKLNYPEDDIVVYSLIFDDYKIKNENYSFVFASKYNWEDLKIES